MAVHRFRYENLDPDQRRSVEDWCRVHKLQPHDVPIDAEIAFDSATNEWVIEQYATRGGYKFMRDGQPARIKVRRAAVADPHMSWLKVV